MPAVIVADIIQTQSQVAAVQGFSDASFYILQGVRAISTADGDGMLIFSSGTALHLDGTLIGSAGVSQSASSTYAAVSIGPTGLLSGYGAERGGLITNSNIDITNRGTISGLGVGSDGLQINMTVANRLVEIVNYGTIEGNGDAIGFANATDAASQVVRLTNYGVIAALSGLAYSHTVTTDTIINRGTMLGNIDLGAENDSFDGVGGRAEGQIFAGTGEDTVLGGLNRDRINGGFGNDHLEGREDNDVLQGEDGNDTLIGGLGADNLFGDSGDDRIYFDFDDLLLGGVSGGAHQFGDTAFNTDDFRPITFFMGARAMEIYRGSAANETIVADGPQGVTVFGGEGDDQIEGAAAFNDILHGETGDDLVNGYGGNDSLTGGFGKDYLIGGSGNDTIRGEQGDDTIFGGDDGDFSLDGGDGSDVIMGEAGSDTIYGGEGNDVWLDGGDGNDVIEGGAGNDLVRGGDGNDPWLNGGAGNDTIIGGAGADNVIGDAGADVIQFYSVAEAGDTIFGFVSGTDKLFVAQSGFGQLTGYIANGAPAPINAGPHLLYNTTTGVLTYDSNGTIAGGQTVLATLSGAPTLLYEDLLFV